MFAVVPALGALLQNAVVILFRLFDQAFQADVASDFVAFSVQPCPPDGVSRKASAVAAGSANPRYSSNSAWSFRISSSGPWAMIA